MDTAAEVASQVEASLRRARSEAYPYRRWYPQAILPETAARAVEALPFEPPAIGDTEGKRETHNSSRRFFDVENRRASDVCESVAAAFESPQVLDAIYEVCGVDVSGNYLRIEHCLDTEGFWLAPHTDLGVKKFTMLLYLSTDPGYESWGTDVYVDADTHYETAPGTYNSALVFVPADNTWHGYHLRPLEGVRRSLIINYVTEEWRNRHELASPDTPVQRRVPA